MSMKYIRKFNENKSLDDIIKMLENDCKPFLDELSTYQSGMVFRGLNEYIPEYKSFKVRKRSPRDMNPFVSQKIDNIFFEKFGQRFRSLGTFTTKNKYVSQSYGATYIFFPIGDYMYFWNENIEDLYTYLSDNTDWYYDFDKGKILYDEEYDNYLKDLIDGYRHDNIGDVDSQEITFMCEDYYLINSKYLDELRYYIIHRKKRA